MLKQMTDIRLFERIKAEQASDRLKDQTRLSILRNAGLRQRIEERQKNKHRCRLLSCDKTPRSRLTP